ncbi:hypothetical protein AO33_04089 [Mycobacterium tuberculosis M1703]|nr:hypothetical protein AO33_04089 [Mycobacterium tuberculosis M1703]
MLHCNPEFLHVVRPKTPRGDGNLKPCCTATRNSCTSSDPKPREGTETFCLMLGRQLLTKSSDPKPREGTETMLATIFAVVVLIVVRPKTPRGDGNSITLFLSVARLRVSSDPKPREGTETFLTTCAGLAGLGRQTQNPERGRKQHLSSTSYADQSSGRQTQNPERGRKPEESEYSGLPSALVVRPKTPRGDGNTTLGHAACRPRF